MREIATMVLQKPDGSASELSVTPCLQRCPRLDEAAFRYRDEEIPHLPDGTIGCLRRDGTACGPELKRITV